MEKSKAKMRAVTVPAPANLTSHSSNWIPMASFPPTLLLASSSYSRPCLEVTGVASGLELNDQKERPKMRHRGPASLSPQAAFLV